MDAKDLEEFEAQLKPVPILDVRPGTTNGRSRGRPRGSKDTRPRATAKPKQPFQPKNITNKIEAWIMLANGMAFVVPQIRQDLLDEVEVHRVAESINTIASKNKMVYDALDTVVTGSWVFEVAIVFGLIGMRRAARHGVLPEQMDDLGKMLLEQDTSDMMSMANIFAGPEAAGSSEDDSEVP